MKAVTNQKPPHHHQCFKSLRRRLRKQRRKLVESETAVAMDFVSDPRITPRSAGPVLAASLAALRDGSLLDLGAVFRGNQQPVEIGFEYRG